MDRIIYIAVWPLGFLWRHKKLAIILIIAGFALTVYNQQFKSSKPDIPAYQSEIPQQIKNLPVIQTTSRYYYVQSFTEDDKNVYLDDFYAFDKEWIRYNSVPLPINKNQIVYRSR